MTCATCGSTNPNAHITCHRPDCMDGRKSIWEFDRYVNGTLMAEGVTIERATDFEHAAKKAAQIASRGPYGETPILVLKASPSADEEAPVPQEEMDKLNAILEREPRPLPSAQPDAGDGPYRLAGSGAVYTMSEDAMSILMAHGVLAKIEDGTYRFATEDEMRRDPGSAGVNHPEPLAVLSCLRSAASLLPSDYTAVCRERDEWKDLYKRKVNKHSARIRNIEQEIKRLRDEARRYRGALDRIEPLANYIPAVRDEIDAALNPSEDG